MIQLTKQDKIILQSYKNIAKGLGILFRTAEIVIHSLENLEHSIIHIENGHISQRNVGNSSTNFILEYLKKEESPQDDNLTYWQKIYFNKTKTGKNIKSISIPIKNDTQTIGFFCINVDIDVGINEMLHFFGKQIVSNIKDNQNETRKNSEILENNFEALAMQMIQSVSAHINNSAIKRKEQHYEIIKNLFNNGFFNIKGSAKILADNLKISEGTVYFYLRKLKD